MRSEKDVVCKPFKNHHAEQLKLVTDFDWIDFDRLSDVDELISSVLSCEEAADYIDEGRIHAITESVQRRIGHLQELAMTQTPRQLDTTEEDLKRMLGVYFEQNVTTERYEDHDGERWVLFGE